MIAGHPFETLKFHRRQLIKELADWIGFYENENESGDENFTFRNKLICLLATASKQNVKDVPLDNSEWTKLLNKWIKENSSGAVVSGREIYKILAVDGFRGVKPKCLKNYLPDILLPLRNEYKSHVNAIRKMYEFFDKNEKVSSLTGTDSACVVFLALLEWYSFRMKDNLMQDDQIKFQVHQAKSTAEGFLQQHGEYFRDIKNVDEEFLKELGEIYAEEFKDCEYWKVVGRELLTYLIKQL